MITNTKNITSNYLLLDYKYWKCHDIDADYLDMTIVVELA